MIPLSPTPQRQQALRGRIAAAITAVVFLLGFSITSHIPTRALAQPQPLGLQVVKQTSNQLSVSLPEHFALILDSAGIREWYDLARDPQRQDNMVARGAHLLEHASGTLQLSATPQVIEQTPVRVRIRWQGTIQSVPYTLEYTIWAGGQVGVALATQAAVDISLHRANGALSGAYLQALTRSNGTITSAMLYLDAWTGEPISEPAVVAGLANAKVGYQRQRGAFQTTANNSTVRITLPAGRGLRQPRFEVANWPGDDVTIQHGDVALVEGADYLSSWNESNRVLTVQYLHLLPAGDANQSTFVLEAAPAATGIRLSIKGRNVNDQKLLVIDGNLIAYDSRTSDDATNPPVRTTQDIFSIPYIQSGPSLTAVATVQEPPAGAAVEFVLNGVTVGRVANAPYELPIQLPTMAEYQLAVYLTDSNGNRLGESDSMAQLGYGHVLIALGDSITAGKWGDLLPQSTPVTSAANSPASSADHRNFYQYDNGTAVESYYFRGYEMDLNDRLTSCGQAPIFILNDGISSLRTALSTNPIGDSPQRAAVGKLDDYNSHIAQIGARGILIGLGTNDSNDQVSVNTWKQAINTLMDGMQTSTNQGLSIWLARTPYRKDEQFKQTLAQQYGLAVPSIVAAQNSASYPVYEGPDFWSYFIGHQDQFGVNPGSGASDNVHPNQTGLNAMAQLWSNAICPHLPIPQPATITPMPTTPVVTTPATTTTTTTPATTTVTTTPVTTTPVTNTPVTTTPVEGPGVRRSWIPLAFDR